MQKIATSPIEKSALDLRIEALEPMEAPGFWDAAAGAWVGFQAVGAAFVGGILLVT